MTHDYKRNGTTTLLAAMQMAEGKLIGQCMPRHRHPEFVKFLRLLDAQTPPDLDLHLILDNYSTHKHPKVMSWLNRHPLFHLHFTPTSSSWLNLIERWFREITDRRIRRGVRGRVLPPMGVPLLSSSGEHGARPRQRTTACKQWHTMMGLIAGRPVAAER